MAWIRALHWRKMRNANRLKMSCCWAEHTIQQSISQANRKLFFTVPQWNPILLFLLFFIVSSIRHFMRHQKKSRLRAENDLHEWKEECGWHEGKYWTNAGLDSVKKIKNKKKRKKCVLHHTTPFHRGNTYRHCIFHRRAQITIRERKK